MLYFSHSLQSVYVEKVPRAIKRKKVLVPFSNKGTKVISSNMLSR